MINRIKTKKNWFLLQSLVCVVQPNYSCAPLQQSVLLCQGMYNEVCWHLDGPDKVL